MKLTSTIFILTLLCARFHLVTGKSRNNSNFEPLNILDEHFSGYFTQQAGKAEDQDQEYQDYDNCDFIHLYKASSFAMASLIIGIPTNFTKQSDLINGRPFYFSNPINLTPGNFGYKLFIWWNTAENRWLVSTYFEHYKNITTFFQLKKNVPNLFTAMSQHPWTLEDLDPKKFSIDVQSRCLETVQDVCLATKKFEIMVPTYKVSHQRVPNTFHIKQA